MHQYQELYLPFANYTASAIHLSPERLAMQVVKADQIRTIIQNHRPSRGPLLPPVRMWQQHIVSVMLYRDCLLREFYRRGLPWVGTPLLSHLCLEHPTAPLPPHILKIEQPPWLGNEKLHSNHRAYLLHEDPEWYARWGWDETPSSETIWEI